MTGMREVSTTSSCYDNRHSVHRTRGTPLQQPLTDDLLLVLCIEPYAADHTETHRTTPAS